MITAWSTPRNYCSDCRIPKTLEPIKKSPIDHEYRCEPCEIIEARLVKLAEDQKRPTFAERTKWTPRS